MKEFRIGFFSDPHFCDKDHDNERFFRLAPAKIDRCIGAFREAGITLAVCLGDFIDYNRDGRGALPELRLLKRKFDDSGMTLYSVLGNHDICQLPRTVLCRELELPCPEGYYAFTCGNWTVAALDTNYDETGRSYDTALCRWDDCYVPEVQLMWLERVLREAPGPVLVAAHANLDPRRIGDRMDPHVVKNHAAVRALLEKYDNVKLVMQGHYHHGCVWEYRGIPYVTLRAVVEGPSNNSAVIVILREDGNCRVEYLF
ncbi:MAG: metallophosphoesterase [Lachnospiraceae bacterium]|nr:metallophosphoesterase [Lachnospiraceae bacterium]